MRLKLQLDILIVFFSADSFPIISMVCVQMKKVVYLLADFSEAADSFSIISAVCVQMKIVVYILVDFNEAC